MDKIAGLFKILSDSMRIRILLSISTRALCVCQLMGALGMSQPRIPRQLDVLKRAELIINSKKGKWVYYKINPEVFDSGRAKKYSACF